ncbi:MAG: GvpL/GvpF family gas vesicle protein [Chloroflexi bacterium]|nr:GvpL/GvpF family gas vesicle protein [Chloroflexota bacterium]
MGNLYLYAIIDAARDGAVDAPGVDGARPVQVLSQDGLGCLVSRHEGPALADTSKEVLVRRLLAHQQVVESVMDGRAVLPVKFGTLLAGPEEARCLLSQGRGAFLDALASLGNKVEMELAATWDRDRVLKELGRDGEVARARAAILAQHRGQPLTQQVLLGQFVKSCMDRRRAHYRERVMSALQPMAAAVSHNLLLSDALVINVAFLVERPRLRAFDEALRSVDQLCDSEITFRLIGPLPPYSFATVEVSPLRQPQLEEARRTLDLEGPLTEGQVRRAYRRLAARQQRDLDPPDRHPGQALARLRQAEELLLRWCRARGETSHDSDGLFSISIRGTRREQIEPSRFGQPGPLLPV